MKRIVVLGLSIATITAIASACWIWGGRYQIVLSQDELLTKLNEKFPFEKTYLMMLNVRLEHPQLELVEGSDRIRFGCEVTLHAPLSVGDTMPDGTLHGVALVSGLLRYNPDDATFFLDDAHVEQLDVANAPEKWKKKIQPMAEKGIADLLRRTPVYRLKANDVKGATARMVLKGVKVHDRQLVVTLGVGG